MAVRPVNSYLFSENGQFEVCYLLKTFILLCFFPTNDNKVNINCTESALSSYRTVSFKDFFKTLNRIHCNLLHVTCVRVRRSSSP